MAWTAPMTFTANTALTAAQLNTYLRDNMLETAPAKATTPGYHFVTDGANSIAERAIEGQYLGPEESTTSTEYTDLPSGPGPQLTVTTGTRAIYMMSARVSNSSADVVSRVAIEISGATSREANDARELTVDGISVGAHFKVGITMFESTLTPGENTFTMKYKTQAGTAVFAERHLIVMAL